MAAILLAEDDESLRSFLTNALSRAGHYVESCGDGIEAVRYLARMEYDLLLADIVMPGLDGIELARRAAEQQPAIKVLFITGFAAVALKAQRSATGGNAKVLSKPFHLRDLVDQVEEILAA